jgi:hypothetical protein
MEKKVENHEMTKNIEKPPKSKRSHAPGLNFKRLANLGSSQVRLAKIGLNFEISQRVLGGGAEKKREKKKKMKIEKKKG